MSKLSRAIAVMMLVLALGLQWTVLQSVAWISMVVSYSREGPLMQALVKTFDGKHPCSLCKTVAQGKRSDQQRQTTLPTKEIDFYLETPDPIQFVELHPSHPTSSEKKAEPRSEPPPAPPPRPV